MSEQETEQTTAPAAPAATSDEQTFPIRLVKQETGDTHWNVALGIYEKIVHAETGEPNSEYRLLATIDGVDVPLLTLNAGGVETIVKSQKALQSQSEA